MSLILCLLLLIASIPEDGGMEGLAPIAAFHGGNAEDRYGELLAVVGDINGDGFPDIAISAPGYGRKAEPLTGALYLYSGFTGDPIGLLEGEGPFDRFGKSMAFAEMDGDDSIDLVLGAPFYSNPSLDGCGRVYIFSGKTLKPIRFLEGQNGSDRFGHALACMDINGDGFEDIVVGAPGFTGRQERTAAVYIAIPGGTNRCFI
jgi:hypothetical protein